MKRKILYIVSWVLTAMLFGYVLVAGVVASRTDTTTCGGLQIIIDDKDSLSYLSPLDVYNYLQYLHVVPTGKLVSDVHLHMIETAVQNHPLVDSAECYTSAEGDVFIHLTQRRPLLHVTTPDTNYFVATDHQPLPPYPSLTTPVLQVRGCITEAYACDRLSQVAEWLQTNTYWNKRIRYIQVADTSSVSLRLLTDSIPVFFGSIEDYPSKFNRLQKWYDNIPQQPDYQPYTELDVSYKGQVIGRR